MVTLVRVVTSITQRFIETSNILDDILVEYLFLVAAWNPDSRLLVLDSFHHEVYGFLRCHTSLSDLIEFEVLSILITSVNLSKEIRR